MRWPLNVDYNFREREAHFRQLGIIVVSAAITERAEHYTVATFSL